MGVPEDRVAGFGQLLERYTARERADSARALLSEATEPASLGFVQLLDPEGDSDLIEQTIVAAVAYLERYAADKGHRR